jgi:hypothetical protein
VTLSDVANWCVIIQTILEILGLLGGGGALIFLKVRRNANTIRNSGDHSPSAQTEEGPVNQGTGTQHIYHAPVTILNPGIETPVTSTTVDSVVENTNQSIDNNGGEGE